MAGNATGGLNGSVKNTLSNTTVEWTAYLLASAFVTAIVEQSEHSNELAFLFNKLGSITKYCCSIYGVTCLVMALVLNRTLVIASTNNTRTQQILLNRNRGVRSGDKLGEFLKKVSIVSFRLGVVVMLLYQGYNCLVALSLLGSIGLPGGSSRTWFYDVLLYFPIFDYDSEKFSGIKYMATPDDQVMLGPTTDMYWPIFLTFCLSSFMETFVSAIQGRKPYTESGITIFEHSLAFQEFSTNGSLFFGSSKFHERPTEQVLVATLFLICNHLNIHIGGLLNNNKYRLIPSTVFGLGFLSYFVSSFFNRKIFGFPLILIITFIPQLVIFQIIALSGAIFILAIIANGFRLQDLNYASFLKSETTDNEVEYSVQNLNIHLNDDFYTALLNLVMISIISAGKSSYITELSIVNMDNQTWVERSMWLAIRGDINPGIADDSNENLMRYFKQNNISGYANIINSPSQRLISDAKNEENEKYAFESSSIFIRRFNYMKNLLVDISQLLVGLMYKLSMKLISRAFGTEVQVTDFETEEEFEKRKQKVPKFLRKYMRRKGSDKQLIARSYQRSTIDLNEYTDEQIEDKYIELLAGQDILENDDSNDYQDVYESEIESEIETEEVTPINDLITGSSFMEMVSATPGNKYLQVHMSNNTRVTRSQYQKIILQENENADVSNKLIQLLLERQMHTTKKSGEVNTDCVICQVNTREIITWPCKCFAICEPCRLSLVAKGMEGCVCCRRDVQGVSKVFIP